MSLFEQSYLQSSKTELKQSKKSLSELQGIKKNLDTLLSETDSDNEYLSKMFDTQNAQLKKLSMKVPDPEKFYKRSKDIQLNISKRFFGKNSHIAKEFEFLKDAGAVTHDDFIAQTKRILKDNQLSEKLDSEQLTTLRKLLKQRTYESDVFSDFTSRVEGEQQQLQFSEQSIATLTKGIDKLPLGQFGDVLASFSSGLERFKLTTQINKDRSKVGMEKLSNSPIKSSFGDFFTQLKDLGKMFKSILSIGGAFAVIGAALYNVYERDKKLRESVVSLGKNTGLNQKALEAYGIKDILKDVSRNFQGVGLEDASEQLVQFLDHGGQLAQTTGEGFEELLFSAVKLNKYYGIQLDLQTSLLGVNNDAVKLNKELNETVAQLTNKGLNVKKVFDDVSELTGNITTFFRDGVLQATRLAAKAKGLGTSLQKVTGFKEKFFDYGEALDTATQINALLGETVITGNRAFQIYTEGPEKSLELIQDIVRRFGDVNELSGTKLRQFTKVAESLGMTADEFKNIGQTDKFLTSLKSAGVNFVETISGNKGVAEQIKSSLGLKNIEDLLQPENFNFVTKLVGGIDQLKKISKGDPTAIKMLQERMGKYTKDQVESFASEIQDNRTIEDKMSESLDGILSYAGDIFDLLNVFNKKSTVQKNKEEELLLKAKELGINTSETKGMWGKTLPKVLEDFTNQSELNVDQFLNKNKDKYKTSSNPTASNTKTNNSQLYDLSPQANLKQNKAVMESLETIKTSQQLSKGLSTAIKYQSKSTASPEEYGTVNAPKKTPTVNDKPQVLNVTTNLVADGKQLASIVTQHLVDSQLTGTSVGK